MLRIKTAILWALTHRGFPAPASPGNCASGIPSATQPAHAQATAGIPPEITTPNKVETRIGTLEFRDGAPSAANVDKVYDNLDFAHAFRVFVDTFQAVSPAAIRNGFLSIGVKDNEILVFSNLMDAKSLFLTANADTVYFVGIIELTKGPMVLETPPGALGAVDDMWWRWIIDFGAPSPRPRRQISHSAAGLRRSAAGGRVLRRTLKNHSRFAPRSLVDGEERSEAHGRVDQGCDQGPSL